MTRKILMGIVWFVAIFFVASIAIGAVVGGIAGGNDPSRAAQAATLAVIAFMSTYRPLIALGALLITAIGAIKGFLPGTKSQSKAP